MKLLIIIVQDVDSQKLERRLIEEKVGVTKLASSGGFLRSGNATFISGVEESRVDEVLEIIKSTCSRREEIVVNQPQYDFSVELGFQTPMKVPVGGATVFVLDVDQFHKL